MFSNRGVWILTAEVTSLHYIWEEHESTFQDQFWIFLRPQDTCLDFLAFSHKHWEFPWHDSLLGLFQQEKTHSCTVQMNCERSMWIIYSQSHAAHLCPQILGCCQWLPSEADSVERKRGRLSILEPDQSSLRQELKTQISSDEMCSSQVSLVFWEWHSTSLVVYQHTQTKKSMKSFHMDPSQGPSHKICSSSPLFSKVVRVRGKLRKPPQLKGSQGDKAGDYLGSEVALRVD